MSVEMLAGRWTAPARRRSLIADLALGLPAALAAGAMGWRFAGPLAGVALGLVVLAAATAFALHRTRRFDRRWLIGALDRQRGEAEDSSDLLFADSATLGPLQRLQRRRIEQRLDEEAAAALAPPAEPHRIAAAWGLGLIVLAAAILLPCEADIDAPLAPAREGLAAVPGVPRLVAQRLVVTPPAYTGLPPRAVATLDARVPAGSRLSWTLGFAPEPSAARLAFLGTAALPLARAGDRWTATRLADRPMLYRVTAAGAERAGVPPLHRIDTLPDQPPRIRLIEPRETLNQIAPGQRRWRIVFEASDDYGVRPTAALRIVLAQGEGENIRFSERTTTIAGSGPARARRFTVDLDLAAIGFTDPGDLVVQLTVADNRAPGPQTVRGPSVILRRPPARGVEGAGLEGMVKRAMPAYFRSQRQIIIDAEALLRARPRISAEEFRTRSNKLGEDQQLLRMRYGKFMGEESGGRGASGTMPTSDAEEGKAPEAEEHHDGDGHDHAAPSPGAGGFGGTGMDVLAEYGHAHDESEAATLLDPETRETLRQALNNMWDSEKALRQADPKAALPFAYRALKFIKQVQQATRIYLARTAIQLPPLDMSRRLTGKRDEMGSRVLPPAAATPLDTRPAAIWRALEGPVDARLLDALARWAASPAARVPDRLALAGAIDEARRDPACRACRDRLRGQLWAALPRPAAGVERRDAGDAAGRRYLDAIR